LSQPTLGAASKSWLEKATARLHIVAMSMDAVFRALADPVRRQLLDRLHARNGQTLGAST